VKSSIMCCHLLIVPVLHKEGVWPLGDVWFTELLQVLHWAIRDRNSARYIHWPCYCQAV